MLSHEKVARTSIDECLRRYDIENPGGIALLAQRLEKDESPGGYGAMLASNHAMFSGERVSKFNRDMYSQSIDSLLEQLKCNDKSINEKIIKKQYGQYETQYKELVDKYVTGRDSDSNTIKTNIFDLSQQAKNKMSGTRDWLLRKKGRWNSKFKDIAVELMAHIFALWTSLNSQYYFDAVKKKICQ